MTKSALVVKIDKSLRQGKSIPDAAAGNWILNLSKAQSINTLIAVADKQVVGVFDTLHAYALSSGIDAGRVRFILKELPQSQWSPYVKMAPFTFNAACKYI